MQKWNLLKKTAPCILSLAVAATSFPTAVMATDFDTAVVSEAEAQEADVEDFGAEEVEAAEDTTEEMTEDIQQDEAADDLEIQEDAVAEEADPVSDGEDEFSAGDDTEEAFSDESQLKGEYQYVYAGLTWGEYWTAEGVYNAGNTSSSDELDLKGEADKGAFDTVTRATANHGLHRGSYQTEATIIATDGTKFAVSYWKDNQTIVLTDGSEATWNRGFLTKDGKEYEMDHYEVYGLKYVPVAVKTADYADFCKKYNVVNAGETISGGYGEMNLQSYVGLIADVTADTNGLKYAEKNGDSFTFTARKSNGTTSGIKGQALKTATDVEPTVKTADGSYGEFLRVDINGNYGDLGANMQAVRWDYYGDDSTYTTKPLASYGTKFAADNWMHKKMGIQLGLTKSARCKLPGGTDGTGYWKLTVYALGYNDYTYKFQATAENIVEPQVEPTDFTDLKAEVETAKALKQADYTVATWKSFAGELAEAEEVIAKTDASQAEVNEALSHLQAAEKELVKVTAALDKKTAAVYTGKTVTLKATSNDKDAKATFTSSNTKVATVKHALFYEDDEKEAIIKALKKYKPESILILGTSDGMVQKIAANLGLPEVSETVYITDVATEEEMETAKRIRVTEGKHVIPVPTFEIKKDFSGYLLDPLQIFKPKGLGQKPYVSEKSIIRPTFSYMGKFTISDSVFRQIAEYQAEKMPEIYKVLKTRVQNFGEGPIIYMEVSVVFGFNIQKSLKDFKEIITKEIENLTAMNVIKLDVIAKNIYIPEELKNKLQ